MPDYAGARSHKSIRANRDGSASRYDALLIPVPFVPTRYTASTFPRTHRLAGSDLEPAYEVRVEWRSEGRWAVTDPFGHVYSKTLCRRHEGLNSSRTDHFKRVYRHSLQDAFVIAEKLRQKQLRWLEEKYPA